ncbi:MAG: DNA recombination protein RmuC [Bacteroidales bacterium]|nr:DNA recombination protein RmuC [Bacteroidales bacterium]MCB9013178.1 DNA recombination protein RmuC [Bacteroidales bacterium]
MNFIELLAGIGIGALLSWIVMKMISGNQLAVSKSREEGLENQLEETKELLKSRDEQLLKATSELSASVNENKNLAEKLNLQKDEIRLLYEKMNIEFKNLANEILEEKSKKFTQQNKENIDSILKPLTEKIKDFEKKVEDAYVEETKQRFSLKEEVKKLADLNLKVSEEAKNLTRALKGESKTQGNWGEMILESILEKSGLVKDRQYFVQQNLKDEEGKNQRPDIVVEYPGERYVIVDSKVSLTAYERYFSAEDKQDQEKYLTEHLLSIKNHIISLSRKNYQELYDVKALDFVMLFLPVEPAYLVAVERDPELWNFAYEKRILLMSPTNLIAALKMISSLWRQEFQNRNAREIAKKSGELLDKFYGLLEDLSDVGNKLKSTQKSYDSSMKKLSEGNGNLIKRAKDIEQLGARPLKSAPKQFREESESEGEDETDTEDQGI